MPTFEPVEFDPYAGITIRPAGPKPEAPVAPSFEPVDHDPFAKTPIELGTGLYNAFDSGVEKMIAGTAGALGDLTDYGAKGIGAASNYVSDKLGVPRYQPAGPQTLSGLITGEQPQAAKGPIASLLDQIPRSTDIQQALNEKYRGGAAPYEAQNGPERYAQSAGEFLLGGVGGAGRKLLQRAGQILLPSVTSETAGHVVKGSPFEPAVRFGGALVGGGAAALASRPSSAAASLRRQLPAGITPQMVDQAGTLIATAKQRGIDLAWPEALSQVAGRPVLTNTMRHLEASPQTEAQMGEFFGGRPQQVESAARNEFNNIAPPNFAPSGIGPAVGKAAEGTVQDVTNAINQRTRPLYDAAKQQRVGPAVHQALLGDPLYARTLREVRNDPALNRTIAHLPDDSVGVIDLVQRRLREQAANAKTPGQATTSNLASANFGDARTAPIAAAETVTGSRPGIQGSYELARAEQTRLRETYLQPLLDGPLGKIAAKDTTTQNAINALFPTQPLANSAHEISVAVSALAKRNPKAASDLVRAHVESVFNTASKDLQTGANPAGGAKFRAQLIGNPQQHANLQAAIEALPQGRQRWAGFKDFLDVLEATGARQNVGSRTAYNAEINKMQSAGGLARDASKIASNPAKAFQPLIDRFEQYKLGKNLSELANILTDPASGAMLKSIAALPKGGLNAQMLALKLLTYSNASSVKKSN